MEPEMVSISVDNAPAFLQLRDKYKQELVEDTRLTKAAVGRQLRHWTKKVRQPFGAPTSGVRATGATTPGDDDFEAGPVQAWFTQYGQGDPGFKTRYHAWRTQ